MVMKMNHTAKGIRRHNASILLQIECSDPDRLVPSRCLDVGVTGKRFSSSHFTEDGGDEFCTNDNLLVGRRNGPIVITDICRYQFILLELLAILYREIISDTDDEGGCRMMAMMRCSVGRW